MMIFDKEEYYEFHESREELRESEDWQKLPDDCKFCNYLHCNECGYEKETGTEGCWKDNPVKCEDCVWGTKQNENSEVYCEYHGEFCEYDETECEYFSEGDDLK